MDLSRNSLINNLYSGRKTILEFNFDMLSIPPMCYYLTTSDIQQLYKIATSGRYAGDIDTKYKMINDIMKRRNFHKLAAGTNRVVYYHLEDPRFVAKVAVDKVGIFDNPSEFKNQEFIKPFCTKVFEVDPTGVVGLFERVNPITSIEEFLSIGDDVFNLITKKIIGKYVLDDIGVTKWMNYGCRMNGFGPVILDFPYVYEIDGNKLYCQHKDEEGMICGGEIDYDSSFDHLVCTKCGRKYKARDLENKDKPIKIQLNSEGSIGIMTRARIIKDGKIYKDSAPSSKNYVSKNQYEKMMGNVDLSDNIEVDKVVHLRSMKRENKNNIVNELMTEYYGKSNATPAHIHGIIKKPVSRPVEQNKNKKKKYKAKLNIGAKIEKPKEVEEIKEVEIDETKLNLSNIKNVVRVGEVKETKPVEEAVTMVEKEEVVSTYVPPYHEISDEELSTMVDEVLEEVRAQDNVQVNDEITMEDKDEDMVEEREFTEEDERIITPEELELIKHGIFNSSIKEPDSYSYSEDETVNETEEIPDTTEYDNEVDYDEYRNNYKRKKTHRYDDDMSEY